MSTNLREVGARGQILNVRGRGNFRQWLIEEGYSPRTVVLYTQLVGRAARHLREEGITLARATADELHDFWITVPATRSSRSGVRYALMAYYRSHGRKDGRPACELPNLPSPYRLPRPVGEDVYGQLLTAARKLGGIHEVMAELLHFTGCRFGELRTAAWHQFDLGEPALWYIEGKGSKKRGPKVRQMPLHPSAAAVLRRWRAESGRADWLFPSERSRDGRLCDRTMREKMVEIEELAGVEHVVPHRWRHTSATIALDRTHDLRAVQEYLGHSSLASTQIYTQVVAGRLTEIIMALPA